MTENTPYRLQPAGALAGEARRQPPGAGTGTGTDKPALTSFAEFWHFAKVMAQGRRCNGKSLDGMTDEELLRELTC